MLAETPSATRAGESRRLQLQGRARHRRATRHLHQIRGTQKFEVHRPLWPESWRHGNVRGRERNSFIFDTDSGKLISERIYYDQAGVVEQMQGKQRSAVA